MGAYDKVECLTSFCDTLYDYTLNVSGCYAYDGSFLRAFERDYMMFPMIPARDVEAVCIDGVVVGSRDNCQAHIIIAAEDKGIE